MTVQQRQSVGFLGLGLMGEAMARNLLKSGRFDVTVWNRTLSKVGKAIRARSAPPVRCLVPPRVPGSGMFVSRGALGCA